jgi:riboflavin kinase / FMN adenylyltransferase
LAFGLRLLVLPQFMQIHTDLSALPVFHQAAATIGTFDGVHSGHQVVLDHLKAEAAKTGGETVVITFHPHPRKVLSPKSNLVLLNTLDEKTKLLEKQGINHLVIVSFTHQFASLSARAYAEEFLIKVIKPHSLIIGYDHHFGHDREGNFDLLAEYAAKGAFKLVQIAGKVLENITISSTKIRQALADGDVRLASGLLGYDYFFSGTVITGNQKGRTIGFPTANIALTDGDKLVPANGVYVVLAEYMGVAYPAMMNIGFRPTAGGGGLTIEAHLLDFDADIYGATLTIYLKTRLRNEQKFDSFEQLKEQLNNDRTATRNYFNLQ